MKKKILFMMLNMNVGGTEKALLNLLSSFPQDKYNITIFMLERYGGFLNHIPHSIKVEYFTDYEGIKNKINLPIHLLAIDLFKKGKLIKSSKYLFYYILTRAFKDRSAWFKFILKKYSIIEQTYDVAVAYAGPNDFISYFIHHKVKANKKIQWVHFDVSKIGFNKKFAAKTYKQFEKIYVVSNEGKEKLVSLLPSLHPRIEVFKNIISPSLIYKQADYGKSFSDNFEGIKILTIGRLSFEKGQDLAIEALAKLRQDGFNVRWYCLGEGNSRKRYEEMIKVNNLRENFILLGVDANPYAYLQDCDIYVQPSRHEGYCLTLAEARCFKKPIVTTNFTGAKEQINSGENGIIVDIKAEEIYMAIKLLINNKELSIKLSANLEKEEFNNNDYLEKLFKVIG